MSPRDAVVAEIPRLRRYARALTGNAAAADDLVQDTLERALGRFALFRPGNLRAWLFSIMHNLFVSQLRASPAARVEGEEALAQLGERAPQEDVAAALDVARGLERLPPDQREVLLLVGLEELSYQEAARVLNVPVGTVMSRLSRARERLRAILGEGATISRLQVVK